MTLFTPPWRQATPSRLRPNCLLTRYPVRFLANKRSFFDRLDPWRGIPAFLRNHGYDAKATSAFPRETHTHLIVEGTVAVEAMRVLNESPSHLASLTLVDPTFAPALEILEQIEIPAGLLIGSLMSANGGQLHGRANQRIAKSWGPVFEIFQGTSSELRGSPFGPAKGDSCRESASAFFLRHCIFLAEYDLTTAE